MRLRNAILIFFVFYSGWLRAADTALVRQISPLPVEKQQWTKSLAGTWLFNPSPEAGFEKQTSWTTGWSKIEVPGEWAMQGFKVGKHVWAGYVLNWVIPPGWAGRRIKLRCDGIYSEAEIFINGKPAATHIGGFTPFETDITNLLGNRTDLVLAVKVKNEGWADSTSAGSSYAVHALGGITRKIQLIALPDINVGAFQFQTLFDKQYDNATLATQLSVKNESTNAVKPEVLFELFRPKTKEKVFSKQIALDKTAPQSAITSSWQFDIPRPLKWDPEHPNLYTYRATLLLDGKAVEVTERKVGFRQIEVRKNRVYVNNMPVKLRGVCHHEVMPLRGRSTTIVQDVADVKIFANGNVNYIRTSHYPPLEELVEACDSVGMFMEVEAPFCWAERGTVPADYYKPILQDQTLDMVDFFRSHAAVLMWSVGNESRKWDEYFKKTAALVKQMDPYRPRNFSQYEPDGDKGELEIGNHHYPGPDGPDKYKNSTRPIVFDEYTHLNAYNRFELVTDPGLRDAWGIGLAYMWEKMYSTPAVLGGALWAGIDDTFIMPDSTAVGFGTWGAIDAWRRAKPEFWHMKKAYSPVRIALMGNWQSGGVRLSVQNRHLFTNLQECRIQWRLGPDSGSISPDVAVGKTDTVNIICKQPKTDQVLSIKVWDARGIMIDEYSFEHVTPEITTATAYVAGEGAWHYKKDNGGLIKASAGNKTIVFDQKNAGSLQVYVDQKPVLKDFAKLMVLPLNPEGDGVQMRGTRRMFAPYNATAANYIVKKIACQTSARVFKITLWDSYDEASGSVVYEFYPDGKATVQYQYVLNKDVNPRQWGMVFRLAPQFNKLNWQRSGLWNAYPANHIGRLNGSATASNTQDYSGPAGPMKQPAVAWYMDQNSMGTNDFRSTKMNIKQVSLAGDKAQFMVTANGWQSSRAWRNTDKTIGLLIAGYSNLGAEKFFNTDAKKFETPLHMGNMIGDKVEFWVK